MRRYGAEAPLVLEVFYPFEMAEEEARADVVASVAACQQALA